VPEVAPSAAQVRAALEELLGWPGISRSPQLSELLRYVVERTLAGDEGAIKAYSIAVDVFGRPATFDPQSDPIVRVQARRLRTLLEQYYDTGKSDSTVQIHLPLGRYVPEFLFAPQAAEKAAGATPAGAAPSPSPVPGVANNHRNRFWLTALVAFCFMMIGVALLVFLLRYAFPPAPPAAAAAPDFPTVTVGAFDNLTGQAVLDDDIAAMAQQIEDDLGKFELLRTVPNGGRFSLHGSVQQADGQFTVKALVSENGSEGIAWSQSVTPAKGATDTEVLAAAASALAARLGATSGPLHAADRAWLMRQPAPVPSAPYVCALEFMVWRDVRRADSALAAADCLKPVLASAPNDAVALAEDASLRSWLGTYNLKPGDDQVAALANEASEAARAVSLMPSSSFAYQQLGMVLARQGRASDGRAALKKAIELNPASMDALVIYGLLQWLDGSFEQGAADAERAIAGVPTPPPYYYTTRAFEAMRERRFYDAIDAAQALAAGDEELGPVIAVAAAPVIGRNDLIDRYRPLVLGNVHFQAAGIMTRIERVFQVPALADRIREGLILAGIPPGALDAPFNADGTLKKQP